MKIGILTFWWSQDNYGQILQCYALQKYLKDLGHEPFLIRHNIENDEKTNPIFIRILKIFNPIVLFRFFRDKNKKRYLTEEAKKHPRYFDDFRTKYILQSEHDYLTLRDLRIEPPAADAYIVGSDQVWNFNSKQFKKIKKRIHAAMLDFGNDNIPKLSYAASWGVSNISQQVINEIKPLLSGFSYVSVREKKGIELCQLCNCNNAELVPDPTLLLDADIYRQLYASEEIRKPQEDFLLLYLLNNNCDFKIDSVYEFAKQKKLKVVYVTGKGIVDNKEKFYATIPEWLYLLDNAKYVISNSFHCAVFSILFEKQFGIIKLTGRHEGMNSRFDTLFEACNINPRYITDKNFSLLDIEYKTNFSLPENHFLQILKTIERGIK